jgi:hypothetical protein
VLLLCQFLLFKLQPRPVLQKNVDKEEKVEEKEVLIRVQHPLPSTNHCIQSIFRSSIKLSLG